MNGQNKVSPSIGRFLYGIGGLSAITEVVLLVLFLPWFRSAGIHEISLLVGAVTGIALPVLIMPLCYAFVNGNTAIATGRYHLPMTAAGLVGSLSFVLLLGVGDIHPVAQAFAVFGLLFAYSFCMQTFRYTYFSVGQRFDSSGKATAVKNVCSCFAVFLAALLVIFLTDGTRDAVRSVVAFAAVVSVCVTVTVYLTTAHAMPSFIRLEPRHKRRLRETYRRFVSPLSDGTVRLFATAAFLVCAGGALAASTVPACVFTYAFGIGKGYKPAVLVMAALVAPVSAAVAALSRKKGEKIGGNLSVAFSSVQLALGAGVCVFLYLPIGNVYKAIVLFSFSVLLGISLGAAFACENAGKGYAAALVRCTPGKYGCLHNCIAALGIAFGLGLSSAVNIVWVHVGEQVAATVACVAYVVLLFVGAVLHRAGYADKRSRKRAPGEEA